MEERAPRVGFLIDRWEPERGGAERAMALLAEHLEDRGCDVRAIALRSAAGAPGRFHAVTTGARRLVRPLHERALAERLVVAAREAECDVTVGMRHLGEVDLYWPHDGAHAATLEARARARGRSPATDPGGRHAVFLELERRLLVEGGARRVACVSELVQDELARLYPACADRLFLAPNGVDLEAFHPRERGGAGAELRARLEQPEGTPLVVFAGRDPVRKGLPVLLAGLARLAGRDWRLLVAGLRHPARWRRVALDHGLAAERVRFAAHLPAPALLSAADLVVVPTWRDACLLVALEALACGTPIVTTRHAGASRSIAPEAGTVLDEPEHDAVAAALDEWLARIAAGAVDRGVVRACVLDRGQAAWLEALEREVRSLAARGQSERRSGGASLSSGSVAFL